MLNCEGNIKRTPPPSQDPVVNDYDRPQRRIEGDIVPHIPLGWPGRLGFIISFLVSSQMTTFSAYY